jgi:hypothetical protein
VSKRCTTYPFPGWYGTLGRWDGGTRRRKRKRRRGVGKGKGKVKGERHVTDDGSDEPIDPDQMRRPTILESLH